MDVIKKINRARTIFEILPQLTVDDLERAIEVAAESYNNSDISLISDSEYDLLVEKLKLLNPKSNVLKNIGAPTRGNKVELPYWMGSMNKIKSEEKLIKKWTDTYKGPYLVSEKLDGISCLLVYEDGVISIYTRGNGTVGQDISHLVDLVNMSTDGLYDQKEKIAIRGELIMRKDIFEKYSKIMSNARNMVAGLVNSKIASINKKQAANVDFVTYEVIEPQLKPSDQMKMLKKWGTNVVYWDIYEHIDTQILDSVLQKRKKKSPYEIDGIIVTENIKRQRNRSGNPPYSFAYKGLSQTANVKVLEVVWRPSKDGVIVPIIYFEKVRLSQADLKRTLGFNAKFIVDNKIGPGAIITVIRSGDVIPYIMGIVKPAKKPALPENFEYEWSKSGVDIILKHPEKNEDVIIQRLTKFMRNIGAENISEGIITRLVREGYTNIPKLISITVDELLDIDGFQEVLAEKIYNNIQEALNNLNMLTLMVASNAFGRGFGERKIEKILTEYPNIVDEYNENDRKKWEDKIISLEGFDRTTAESFLDNLPYFKKFYRLIKKNINVKPYKSKIKKNGIFKDQTIVFSGFRNKDWAKFIKNEGGKVGGSVSKNTSILVLNDGEDSSTTKAIKAKQLGVTTINKSQFAKKYKI